MAAADSAPSSPFQCMRNGKMKTPRKPPRTALQHRFQSVGKHAGHVVDQSAAGDVRDPMNFDLPHQLEQRFDVDSGGSHQPIDETEFEGRLQGTGIDDGPEKLIDDEIILRRDDGRFRSDG